MKINVLIAAMVLLWVILSIVPLGAEPRVKDYDQLKDLPEFKTYIGGVGTGFAWANAYLQLRGQKPLYCQPEKISLEWGNYLQVLDRKLKDDDYMKQVPLDRFLGLVLLRALQETFPCDK